MRVRIMPGRRLDGKARVPGDKSVAHRWIILAATAIGRSALVEVPRSLDVRSTASCLARITSKARPALDAWSSNDGSLAKGQGSTWNVGVEGSVATAALRTLEVEGEGRSGLVAPAGALDCGNAGTTMRLLSGVLASAPFETELVGDRSLSTRPMERVAQPLRSMGAVVETADGHAPLRIVGGALSGIVFEPGTPSAQVKSAVLLAGLDADGRTEVREPIGTRDHTERALAALGAPTSVSEGSVILERYQHEGFAASVPGDPSSGAFLVAAAALSGSELTIVGVGLNPSRTHFLEVMARMGIRTERRIDRFELGEPVGELWVAPSAGVDSLRVEPGEIPLVIDEIPVLALLAAHADSESRFLGASELRVKESDRLKGIAAGIRGLGGAAAAEGHDLVVGGGGLQGGRADAMGDHRMAMAFAVAALSARGPSEVDGMQMADVSFPGFVATMQSLGASLEELP